MTGIFTPAYSVSKRTGSDGPAAYLAGGLDYSNRAAEQVESLDAQRGDLPRS
jgi:hypothetical protein